MMALIYIEDFYMVKLILSLIGAASTAYVAYKLYQKAKAGVAKVEAVVEQVKKDL